MADSMPNSVQELIVNCLERFPDKTTARLDAEILIAHSLNRSRSWLKAFADEPLSEGELAKIMPLLDRRAAGEPVAYILEEWEFYSLPLKVTPATLIPRPETELLVERVLQVIEPLAQPRVLDLGTGTGAIAIAIGKHRPDAKIVATDFSQQALAVAQYNAERHGCAIQFYCGSWYQPLPPQSSFDCIVSNPPYVAQDDPHLQQGDLTFEPLSALTAGQDELADLRHIIHQAPQWLEAQGTLLVEHGYNQKQSVQGLFSQAGFTQVVTHRDYGQQDRFTEGRRELKLNNE
jgi:release factor glutamine methyltransferase